MTTNSQEHVAHLVERFLPTVREYLEHVVGDAGELEPMLRYHMGWQELDGAPAASGGGKALRPVLCLAACEMAGGNWQEAIPAAASLELIHNFSLIHDDIQDGDKTRRGRSTLWSIWGIPVAIAAGNAMRAIADRTIFKMGELGITSDVTATASAVLTTRYLEMIEGQYLDMWFESSEHISAEDYLDMVGRKTGALIESAMYMGALVASADSHTANAFGECGRRLGIAFQVRDDYLGVWGDPLATGKPVGADIRRKKKSLPTVYLFDRAAHEDRAWLNETFAASEIEEAQLGGIMAMLDGLEGSEYVQSVAEAHAKKAVESVTGLLIPSESKRQLDAVAEFFVRRNN